MDRCTQSYLIETSWQVRSAYVGMIVFTAGLAVLIIKTVKQKDTRHVPAHPNFKKIIFTISGATCWFSVLCCVSYIVLLITSLRATKENCFTNMYRYTCALIRGPHFLAIPMYSSTHIALFLERLVAISKKDYENSLKWLGWFISLYLCFASVVVALGVLDIIDMKYDVLHCTYFSDRTKLIFDWLLEATSVIDIFSTVGDFILKNRVAKSSRKVRNSSSYHNYTLSQAYQKKENLRLLLMMVPISTVFAVGHLFFCTVYLEIDGIAVRYFTRNGETELTIEQEAIRTALSDARLIIFVSLIGLIVRQYVKLGEKLMLEKQTKTDKPDANKIFDLFNQQLAGPPM
ncbi:unnamed protein product [Bursaphelenchus okinawaensis]|uniref:G_PROTEIN_RECEP_F1_2 domain-containing protein n=1 Tax=Bursaphelenchus okinawaensis TaxID=465554 RepID=A0A811L3D7_9BILA|nr:unnamed protein product [Bursaphelenchus okinawaensis]CAG9115612.1 unnamed protein product [Bursaphelenchus okinawaensis]